MPCLTASTVRLVTVCIGVASVYGFDGINAEGVKGLKQLPAWNAVVGG